MNLFITNKLFFNNIKTVVISSSSLLIVLNGPFLINNYTVRDDLVNKKFITLKKRGFINSPSNKHLSCYVKWWTAHTCMVLTATVISRTRQTVTCKVIRLEDASTFNLCFCCSLSWATAFAKIPSAVANLEYTVEKLLKDCAKRSIGNNFVTFSVLICICFEPYRYHIIWNQKTSALHGIKLPWQLKLTVACWVRRTMHLCSDR